MPSLERPPLPQASYLTITLVLATVFVAFALLGKLRQGLRRSLYTNLWTWGKGATMDVTRQ
jgi:hypothetical protein